MPGLDAEAKEKLLLHQFVAGLPPAISKPLRAAGNTTDLRSTVERAKLLNALENEQQTAGVTPPSNVNPIPTNAAVEKLTEQVAALTEQVAALSAVQQRRQDGFNARPRPVRCYQCGKVGHIRRNCRNRPAYNDSIRVTPEGCLQRATDTLHASEPNRSSVRRVHQKHIRGEWTSGGNNGGGDAGLRFFSVTRQA